jgi:cyanate lyase
MTRAEVTEMIVAARLKKGISWTEVAKVVGGRPVRFASLY